MFSNDNPFKMPRQSVISIMYVGVTWTRMIEWCVGK